MASQRYWADLRVLQKLWPKSDMNTSSLAGVDVGVNIATAPWRKTTIITSPNRTVSNEGTNRSGEGGEEPAL